jgi:metal-sulfur cluster biosynthetic enzyme
MTPRTSPAATRKLPRHFAVLHSWEPPLAEMLADPVVQAVMTVDGVQAAEVETLMREARARLGPSGRNS